MYNSQEIVIKFFALVIFFYCLSVEASELLNDLSHPFYKVENNKYSFFLQSGYFVEENEFEKAKVTQDLFEYDHLFYRMGSVFNVHKNTQAEINVEAQSNGTLYKKYSPALNLPVQDVYYHGFHAIEIKLQQFLKTDSDNDSLMFQLKLKGSPLKGKESNNTSEGKDVAISLFWSHKHNQWRGFGEIKSEIIGRKKIIQSNGDLETFDTYSRFGSMIGAQWLGEKFWLEGSTLFYLTTDYNTRSPTYSRTTDKGFVIGGKILTGYFFNPKSSVTIEHVRSGSNFNIVTDSTTDITEYEIEIKYTKLGFSWLF